MLVHYLTKTILDRGFQEIYQKVYHAYLEGMKTIIQHGVAAGDFREVDPDETAYGLMALIEGSATRQRLVLFDPFKTRRNASRRPAADQDSQDCYS